MALLKFLQTDGEPTGKIKVNDPPDSDQESYIINLIKPYLGRDAFSNPAHVRGKLLKSEDYLHEVTANIFKNAIGPEEQLLIEDNPELYDKTFMQVSNYLREGLVRESFKGENVRDAILNRTNDLHFNKDIGLIPIDKYKKAIQTNPDRYESYGVYDKDSKEISMSDNALRQKLSSDENFRKDLLGDFYTGFVEDLNRSHNLAVLDDNDPEEMAVAFSIYENFGSEGVTHYVNYRQHYEEGTPVEEQPERVRSAIDFLTKVEKDGLNPLQYVNQFIGGEDKPEGQFEITPFSPSIEMTHPVPHDLNNFSAYALYREGTFEDSIKETLSEIRPDPNWWDKFTYSFRDTPDATVNTFWDLLKSVVPKSVTFDDPEEFVAKDDQFYDAPLDEIVKDLQNGFSGHLSRYARYELMQQAKQGELFTVDDIVSTIVSNSNAESEGKFQINYEDADDHVKLAIDLIRFDTHGLDGMITEDNGMVTIEPNYFDRIQNSDRKKWLSTAFWEPVVIRDPETNEMVGFSEVPKRGAFVDLGTFVQQLGVQAGRFGTQILGTSFAEPILRDLDRAIPKGTAFSDGIAKTRSQYHTHIRQNLDYDIQQNLEGFLPNAGAMLGYLGSYIAGASKLGNAQLSSLGTLKGLEVLAKSRQAGMGVTASQFGKPEKYNRLGTVLSTLSNEVGKVQKITSSGTGRFINPVKFEIGAVQLESMLPASESFFAYGPESFEEAYKRSNLFTQVFSDILVAEALAGLFDVSLATVRYGSNLARGKGGRGAKFDYASNDYTKLPLEKYTWKDGWSPEVKRFWKNINDLSAELPIGNVKDAYSKRLGNSFKTEFYHGPNTTFADVTVNFAENNREILSELKPNINSTLKHYYDQFGVEYDAVALRDRTDEIYNETMDAFAENVGTFLRTGKTADVEVLPLRFASQLEELAPRLKAIGTANEAGEYTFRMPINEAQNIQSRNPGSIIRQQKDGSYSVFHSDPENWAFNLSQRIRRLNNQETFEEELTRVYKQLDLDPETTSANIHNRVEKIRNDFQEIYGREVNIAGKRGYIKSMDADGYIVRDIDGNLHRGVEIPNIETTINKESMGPIRYHEEAGRRIKKVEAQPNKMSDEDIATAQNRTNEKTTKVNDQEEYAKRINQSAKAQDDALGSPSTYKPEAQKTDTTYPKLGLTEPFFNAVNKWIGYTKPKVASARKIIKAIGHDGRVDYSKLTKQKGPIQRLKASTPTKDIPTNTIFTTRRGKEEHFITVKKLPDDVDLTMWVLDDKGGLTLNPYVRRIERNVTIDDAGMPTLYTRDYLKVDGETKLVFRPVREGEDGFIINVQRPTNDLTITEDKIVSYNIDGKIHRVNDQDYFELINPAQQVIDPRKIKQWDGTNYSIEGQITAKPTKQELDRLTNHPSAQDEMLKMAVPREIWGAVVGSVIHGATEGEPYEVGTGTILGAMATWGTRRGVRAGVRSFFGGRARKAREGLVDKEMSHQLDVEQKLKKSDEIRNSGMKVDPFDDDEVNLMNQFLKETTEGAGQASASVLGRIANHKWVTSKIGYLERLGSTMARKYGDALVKMNHTIGMLYESAPNKYNTLRYNTRLQELQKKGMSLEEAKKSVEDFSGAYEEFRTTRGAKLAKEKLNELGVVVGDENAQRQFNDAFARLMHSGARTSTQIRADAKNVAIREVYENPDFGKTFMDLDRALLETPEFSQFVEAHRSFFNDIKVRWLGILDQKMEERLTAIRHAGTTGRQTADGGTYTREQVELLDDFLASGLPYREFRQNLGKKKQRELSKLKNKNQYRSSAKVIEMRGIRDKFTDLEGQYFPQILSRERVQRYRAQWIDGLEGTEKMTADEIEQAWQSHFMLKVLRVNSDAENLRRYKVYDEDSQNLMDQTYKTNARAVQEVEKISDQLLLENPELAFQMKRNPSQFIKETDLQAHNKFGGIKFTPEGEPLKYKRYVIQLPEGTSFEDISKLNGNEFQRFYQQFTNNFNTPTSNFLERPRLKNLPLDFLETDVDQVRRKYSFDVGRRIHNAENNMMDHDELANNWLRQIKKEVSHKVDDKEWNSIQNRLESTYVHQNNMVGRNSSDFAQEMQNAHFSNIARNVFFSRFGFGFSRYNFFEWGVVGPNISSRKAIWDTLKTYALGERGRESLQAYTRFLDNAGIVRRQIGDVRPEFERISTGDMNLNDWSARADYISTGFANKVADFSIMGTLFKRDVENWGLFRLIPVVGDSFMGTNIVSSAINARAAMHEANNLARIAKQLKEVDGIQVANVNGKQWTEAQVKRKLRLLGITDDGYDNFVRKQNEYEQILKNIDDDPNFTHRFYDENPEFYEQIVGIARTSTESYHGTNSMFRPEKWDSPGGKLLSMYSTYGYNFALQHVGRRIINPITDWNRNYGAQLKTSKAGHLPTVMNVMRLRSKGDFKGLREMGLSNEAIENLPIDAYATTLKLIGTLGFSVAGYASTDVINDMLAYPIKEATGQEQWRRANMLNVLNPYAPEEEQVTWRDIFENDTHLDSFMKLAYWSMGATARAGAFGKWGDFITSSSRLRGGNLMYLSPVTGTMADAINYFGTDLPNKEMNLSFFTEDLPKDIAQTAINWAPVLGSGTFSEFRKGVFYEEPDRPKVKYQTTDTGELLTPLDFNVEL